MPMFPLEVEVNEANILKLRKVYKKAYKTIVNEIMTATDWGVANRRQLLGQIEGILSQLGVDVDKFIRRELPKYYKVGARDAVQQLTHVGASVDISEGFNRIHQEAIEALIDETSKAFLETLSGVNRSARLLIGRTTRDLITQKLAEGSISGSALREVRNNIKGILQERGLAALVDRGGHTWELDRYAEMLLRTKAVETRNRGLANRMVENGFDLVQVSDHNSTHKECAVWEGKLLSLTGNTEGYPTLAQAEKAGLFHPNCKHAINVITPELASETKAYDSETGTYKKGI